MNCFFTQRGHCVFIFSFPCLKPLNLTHYKSVFKILYNMWYVMYFAYFSINCIFFAIFMDIFLIISKIKNAGLLLIYVFCSLLDKTPTQHCETSCSDLG